jgi:hypothetical protein
MRVGLPDGFDLLYQQLLCSTMGALKADREYVGFAARRGDLFQSAGGLLVCGRATNGSIGKSAFTCHDLQTEEGRRCLAKRLVDSASLPVCCPQGESDGEEAYRFYADSSCDGDPMHWVRHPRQNVTEKKSQYWQCAKEVALGLDLGEETWYRRIAWSNLYKISPNQPKANPTSPSGNPGAELSRAQLCACVLILAAEIRHFRPQWAIFLTEVNCTSGYFDPFRGPLGVKNLGKLPDSHYVREFGTLNVADHECCIVLAQHPQGKGRKPIQVAKEILRAISSCAALTEKRSS